MITVDASLWCIIVVTLRLTNIFYSLFAPANITIISREGASGDFPGCTNLAYDGAISDGADILDCPVQMTKDGIPFCLGSINLIARTTIAGSNFSNLVMSIPELNVVNGILSFNLTWSEIRDLTRKLKHFLLTCS